MALWPPLAALAAVLADIHTVLLVATAAFVVAAWRGRWVASYLLLWTGPALFGFLVAVHARWTRTGPLPPSFPLVDGPGNLPAALAVAGLVAAVFLSAGRPRRSRWLAPLGLATAAACAAQAALALDEGENVLLGMAVGGAWAGVGAAGAWWARRALEGHAATGDASRHWDRLTAWADRHVWGNARLLVGLIALGLLARLPGLRTWALGPDADRYAAMADALNRNGEFLLPWGDIYSPGTGPQYSHHFPPLYPAVLAGFYKVLGLSEATTRVAAIVLALLAVAVTYLCTKDLYGRTKALVATAVVSLSPALVMTTDKAYAENLLLALFVLAMWAILKSLGRPWFIVWAGVFAGLGYLTKSSMGYFFIVAGLGGLAWRLHWRGWKVLRDPAYVLAILLFGAMVAWWAWRNWLRFGSFSTSAHLEQAYANAAAHPLEWARLLVFSFLVMFGLGYLVYMAVLPWLPQLRRIPRLASEHDSGLWLAIGLPLALTLVIDSALWLYEQQFFLHNVRYVSFVLVPLVWLLMRHVRPSKATWAAIGVSFAILVAGAVYYTLPNRPLNTEVAGELGKLVQDGDSFTFVGDNDVYRYYFAITKDGREMHHDVHYDPGPGLANATTTWVVLRGTGAPPPPYGLAFEMSQGAGVYAEHYSVWRRG